MMGNGGLKQIPRVRDWRLPDTMSRWCMGAYCVHVKKPQRHGEELRHPRQGDVGHYARSIRMATLSARKSEKIRNLDGSQKSGILHNDKKIELTTSPLVFGVK